MAESVINYASKFSDIVDERFSLGSVTDNAVNKEYEFDGVNTVSVYSVDVAPLNDYNRKSSNRYGVPVELGNAKQVLELKQDKAFTFTIDKGNYNDTMMANSAAKALERQITEVITPAVDRYRLSVIAKGAGIINEQYPVTINYPYNAFLAVSKQLTENRVPLTGRIAFLSPDFYYRLLQDKSYTGMADRAADLAAEGGAKMIDGVKIIVVPSDYLPENTNFLVTHPCACTSPVKLAEYTIHEKPQGISGWLVEGRVYYDAFVLKNKKMAIAISKYIPAEDTTEEPSEAV